MAKNSAMSNCLKVGIKIYPVHFLKDEKIEKTTYKKNNWYIQVSNNGKLKTYSNSIGVGNILRSHTKRTKSSGGKVNEWGGIIDKIYDHWNELINKTK